MTTLCTLAVFALVVSSADCLPISRKISFEFLQMSLTTITLLNTTVLSDIILSQLFTKVNKNYKFSNMIFI